MQVSMDEFWKSQDSIYQNINRVGMATYVAGIPNLHQAFYPQHNVLGCMDERIDCCTRHAAGSLILRPFEEALSFIRRTGAHAITSHAECGAALMAAERAGQPTDPESVDRFAEEWTRNLAKSAGIAYGGHISVRPRGLHIARAVYYDSTGIFNPIPECNFPPGLVIDRGDSEPKYAKEEVELALEVMLGEHGFGEERFKISPILIVPVSQPLNTQPTLAELTEELKEIPTVKKVLDAGIAKIDGFQAPVF